MAVEVTDEDFQEILAQTRHFLRTAVVPREQEILDEDRVPDDLRDQAKKMGLFGYAIPQEWGGLGLNLVQDVEMAMGVPKEEALGSIRLSLGPTNTDADIDLALDVIPAAVARLRG